MEEALRMRKTWQGVLVGIVVVVLWTAGGYAQDRGMGPLGGGGYGDRFILRLFSKVGLTDDQKAQMKAVIAKHRQNFHDFRQQLHAMRDELTDKLLNSDPLSTTDLQTFVDQGAKLHEQLLQEGINTLVEMRALLTPDQLALASRMKDQLRTLHTQMQNVLGGQP
jgi:Spy/CpxP family protein refolding chaperone